MTNCNACQRRESWRLGYGYFEQKLRLRSVGTQDKSLKHRVMRDDANDHKSDASPLALALHLESLEHEAATAGIAVLNGAAQHVRLERTDSWRVKPPNLQTGCSSATASSDDTMATMTASAAWKMHVRTPQRGLGSRGVDGILGSAIRNRHTPAG
jgi:hypothetical protein